MEWKNDRVDRKRVINLMVSIPFRLTLVLTSRDCIGREIP